MIHRQRRLLNGIGAVLITAMCAVVTLLLSQARDRTLDDLRRDTRNLATALALNMHGIVNTIDLALVAARDGLALLEHTGGGNVPPELGVQVLRDSASRIGMPVLMRALDTQGRQLFSSDGPSTTAPSADRDYFMVHMNRDAGLYISQPFVSRINNRWVIAFSRRLTGADGEFKGVLLVGTPLELFENVFDRFEVGTRGSLAMTDDSGVLLARRPAAPQLVGTKVMRDDGPLALLRKNVDADVLTDNSPVDNTHRTFAFQRVSGTRLVVFAGRSTEDWLAGWRHAAALAGSATVVCVGLALFAMSRTARHARQMADQTRQLQRSEERTRSILAQAPAAFIGMDCRGLICEWNAQAEATLGWKAEEVMGLAVADVVIPAHLRAHHNAGFEKFVVTGSGPVVNQRIEVTALHRDGRELPVELSIAALHTPDGYMANAFLHDITERKAAAARITASNRRLMAITDNLPLLVSYIDKDERIRFANWTWRDWLGIEPASIIGRPMAEVVGASAYEQRREQLKRALAGEQITFEAESVAQGVNRYLQTVYIPDLLADGSVDGVYAVSTDITTSKQVELRLEQLAHIDPLTALPNRRRFDEKLGEAIARSQRNGQPMALMLLDVDHFKQINDTHGHLAGDAVLKEFARRIQRRLRVTDTAARYAGDEFAVILEGLGARDDVDVVARKICEDLQPWFQLPDRSLKVTSSIGAAIFKAEAISPADAVRKADEALYEAKRAGRARFVVRQP